MPESRQALRGRIRSIRSTRKITSAMEMISNAKLFRQRSRMESNREFSTRLQSIVNEIMVKSPQIESPFMVHNKQDKALVFVFCSDMGLAGGYNANVMKELKAQVPLDSEIVLIGSSLRRLIREAGYPIRAKIESDHVIFSELKKLLDSAVYDFQLGKIGKIQILHTKFVNTMRFEPIVETILPFHFDGVAQKTERVETLFEPNPEVLLNALIPMMLTSVLYSHWLESTTSEQGSRRIAMKTATDNADELSQQLQLEYNKIRQAAITQEITEIVGGASVES
ncbi:ATP synthase F1 subunit gamma [Bulleidia sp. zg-1006]|uniref:ATP synthase F1 subunit gamma n=1 Tax=Bulleidia sp. zg-1006 TaxID=2806552 RepID=UPI00193AC86A|nr:ATP synthase F1 subunit gamma [Bulleidia sp. zg-1006]QRG86765.1 ATP synthase F1 subunit gamma [Bulleidia sp. zg-1006]